MGAACAASVVDPGGSPKPRFAKSSKLRGCTILASQSIGAARRRHDRSRTGGRSRPRWRRSNDLDRVPLDKGNGADNLSDERQTVGATKPQSSATMSLAGRWMRRVRFGTCVDRSTAISTRVRLFRLFGLIHWPAVDPEEKRGPASDKNWSC